MAERAVHSISMRDRRVLVTGAGGFIGSHLCEALVNEGAQVRALTHYNSRSDWGHLEGLASDLVQELEVRAGHVQDAAFCDDLVRDVDTIFHLAALVAIPYSYVAPSSFVETNVVGTLNVLEAARRHGVRRIVVISTSEVYGTAQHTPIDEQHPLQAQSPYAASKIAAEKLAESYWRSFETPVVTLRPFNSYGPRQSARAFVPSVLSQVLTADVVRVGSLDPIRDMTYVSDTVRGFIAAATRGGIEGRTFNLGSGEALSMSDLLDAILEVTNRSVQIEQDSTRVRPGSSEVLELASDSRAAAEELGWRCEVGLREGLAHAADWVAAHLDEYKPHVYNI